MSFKTADLHDAHADRVQVAEPVLRAFGGRQVFHGPISTVKTHEDNSLVRAALEEPGEGHVPGHHVYADEDGLLVAAEALA